MFVEQKFTAETLCKILEEYSRLDQTLNHLKPDFAYSPGSNLNCKDPRQREIINHERKKLKTTLAKFKTGTTNTIVSTSVIEEGLDVRSCNLVIKFDFPQTFRSYIQSKGRARAKPSKYILMMSQTEQGMRRRQYQEFQDVEELSLRECHYRQDEEVYVVNGDYLIIENYFRQFLTLVPILPSLLIQQIRRVPRSTGSRPCSLCTNTSRGTS